MQIRELTQIGNSVGIVLPEEMLRRLKLKQGARVFVTDTPEGIALTRYDDDLEEQLSAGRKLMQQFHTTFEQLAK